MQASGLVAFTCIASDRDGPARAIARQDDAPDCARALYVRAAKLYMEGAKYFVGGDLPQAWACTAQSV